MNKVVRTHTVAGQLPEHLRGGIDPSAPVVVTVEASTGRRSWPELRERIEGYRRSHEPRFRSTEEIDEYLRAVRDGGDLSQWFKDESTSTPTS